MKNKYDDIAQVFRYEMLKRLMIENNFIWPENLRNIRDTACLCLTTAIDIIKYFNNLKFNEDFVNQ